MFPKAVFTTSNIKKLLLIKNTQAPRAHKQSLHGADVERWWWWWWHRLYVQLPFVFSPYTLVALLDFGFGRYDSARRVCLLVSCASRRIFWQPNLFWVVVVCVINWVNYLISKLCTCSCCIWISRWAGRATNARLTRFYFHFSTQTSQSNLEKKKKR